MTEFSLILQRASLFGLAALVVALALQCVLSSRAPAAWRVWIWRAALLQTALALLPIAPLALAVLPAQAPTNALVVQAPASLPATEIAPAAASPMPAIETMPREAPALSSAPASESNLVEIQLGWRQLAVWIYLFGIAVQLLLLLRNARRVRRTTRVCTPIENARLSAIAARLQIRHLPRLLQSEGGAPFLVGIFRPMIVLPRGLNLAHLDAVLAHELAHLRRKDLAWNAVLWALQTALWFHPLTFIARRFHALEVESACDELTLQLTAIAPKSYGALLIHSMNKHHSPLTAGVGDGFFALKTRLKRLGQTPKTPRKRLRWLFVAALLVSFGAALPLRLVSRAQTENEAAPKTKTASIGGVVRDAEGKIVAGATVYAMNPLDSGGEPLAQTVSDAKGAFALPETTTDRFGLSVFVDAGKRGIAEKHLSLEGSTDALRVEIKLPRTSTVSLRFEDAQHQPVKDLAVRLLSVGGSLNSWMSLPRAVQNRMRATTDKNGLATFPPLPQEMWAQFVLADQIFKTGGFGMGDIRGVEWAPLAVEDALWLNRASLSKSVTLLRPIRLEGQVSLPDGAAKGNVLILARRINAAEAAGNEAQREQLIASTRSNAQGYYLMDGLRPGRYYVWVYPEKQLFKDFAGASYTRDLNSITNRVNFQLSRGAIVQGVVISKATQKPVKGQTMWLFDSQENNQYTITDARGYFKFRALGGQQRLRVHANGFNSPPSGFVLPAQSEFNFAVKDGEKREFKIEMPGAAIVKPIRGVVLGPDGQPAANARVTYRSIGGSFSEPRTVESDAAGRFALPLKNSGKPAQLFADAGEQVTPVSMVALVGGEVKLRLAEGAWASLEGRVLDENQKPVAGAELTLHTVYGNAGTNARTAKSDANGRYRFERVRPGTGAMIKATKAGFSQSTEIKENIAPGQAITLDLSVKRAPQTLSGTVINEDGTPARGFQVWGGGQNRSRVTRADGRFELSQVYAGPITVQVTAPDGNRQWRDFSATGGDKNVVLRLTKAKRDDRFESGTKEKLPSPVGKSAPPIRATQWSNNQPVTLDSLRGGVVLLAFDNFGLHYSSEIQGVARALEGRAQIVGVQLSWEGARHAKLNPDADELARELGFPIAVDAALPTRQNAGWQTYHSYGNAKYVVIGPDGKIVYAGDALDRALTFATNKAP